MAKATKSLKERVLFELKEFFVIVVYLWVVLALFLLYKSVLLNEEHLSVLAQGFALINALVLGKIILIARALHLGEQFNDWPLIYPTVIKSALFSIVLAGFKILEGAVTGLFHHESFDQSIAGFGGGTLKGILTLTLLMFVVLIPFFGFTELQRILGEGKLAQAFFGPRDLESAAKSAA